jgi:tetratricopeptide (TPR) repeat protein
MRRRGPNPRPSRAHLRDVERVTEAACRTHARAIQVREAGNPRAAILLASRAVRQMRSAVGDAHPDVANLLLEVARGERDAGRFASSEAKAREAYRILAGFARLRMPAVVRMRVHAGVVLAGVLVARGAWPEARRLYARALVLATHLGASDLDLATVLNDRAVLHKLEGRFEDASRLYTRAVAIVRRAGASPDVHATLLHNLAGLDHDRGHFRRAARHALEGLAVRRRLLGPGHPAYAADLAAYASILDGMGKHGESRRASVRALRIFERALGREHYEVGMTLHNLAAACAADGHLADARRHYERSLAIKRRALGTRHPYVVATTEALRALSARP